MSAAPVYQFKVIRRTEMERQDEIRTIAYALWVQEGHNHWKALEHWLRAEAIRERNKKALQATEQQNKVPVAGRS